MWKEGISRDESIATHAEPGPNRSSLMPSSGSTLQSQASTRASCSSLDPQSAGRFVAKDLNPSSSPNSQVWQTDASMDEGAGRPVAGPNERTTSENLADHDLCIVEHEPKTWSCLSRIHWTRFFLRSDLGNIYECLHVGLGARRQGPR